MRAIVTETVHFGRGLIVEFDDGSSRELPLNAARCFLNGEEVCGWYEANDGEGYVVVRKRERADGGPIILNRNAEGVALDTRRGSVVLEVHGTGFPAPDLTDPEQGALTRFSAALDEIERMARDVRIEVQFPRDAIRRSMRDAMRRQQATVATVDIAEQGAAE